MTSHAAASTLHAPAISRRSAIALIAACAGLPACSSLPRSSKDAPRTFEISLAQWSLNRALFAGEINTLQFAAIARSEFGINAVEYVNQFFRDKATDQAYLREMKTRADDVGVQSLLIMIDGEGALGDADSSRRTTAIENHYKWVEAARYLGCHSIRVNAASSGTAAEQRELVTDGLHRLTEFASDFDINVLVENHGGLSSNGKWLASVIRKVNLPRCGTLPDFGNFRISESEQYDRYKGVRELMPYAKAVSAKSHDFDNNGNETSTNYRRMMKIVLNAGYRGYVGIEYEGNRLSEFEGIRLTQGLLVRIRSELAASS